MRIRKIGILLLGVLVLSVVVWFLPERKVAVAASAAVAGGTPELGGALLPFALFSIGLGIISALKKK